MKLIKFKCPDGSQVHAVTPSLALLYWMGQYRPREIPEDFDPHVFTVIVGKSMPGPYDKIFMSLAIATLENNFGKSPEINQEVLSQDFCEDLPDGLSDHKIVDQLVIDGHPKVVRYERTCMDIIAWLSYNSYISDLEISKFDSES